VNRLVRGLLLLLFATFFLVPLFSMLDFSTRDLINGGRTGQAWAAMVQDEQLRSSIVNSLVLAVVTVVMMLVLLLPTMVWARLRVPRARRLIEILCLLPLTVPALVIVVGITNVYSWVYYFFGSASWTLTFAYVVLVLPFAYRSLDAALGAIDAVVLSEAARSLGAGWFTVIVRVIMPNVWTGVLSAAFISVALVLGEYTFASLLNFQTLPVTIAALGKSDTQASVAASLASLLFATALLLGLSFVGRGRTERNLT
jgi:putative spermidine/putrescine transport system permease protein